MTKYAGSVRKGFALIGGILLTAMLQSFAYNTKLTANQEIGGILAVCAMYNPSNFGVGWQDTYKIDRKKQHQKMQAEMSALTDRVGNRFDEVSVMASDTVGCESTHAARTPSAHVHSCHCRRCNVCTAGGL